MLAINISTNFNATLQVSKIWGSVKIETNEIALAVHIIQGSNKKHNS